jgi:hypothetical protein
MAATRSLKIAGIEVSLIAALDLQQSIEPISGSTLRRMASGAGFKMGHWRKYRISLSGSGWVPAPLNAINYDAPFEIELPFPVAFAVGESLPAGWSQRSAPWGEHTVTDQAGVSVRYIYPKLTVFSDGPLQSHDGNPSWEMTLEQS